MQKIVNKNDLNLTELVNSLPDFVEEKLNAISFEERETKVFVYNVMTKRGYYVDEEISSFIQKMILDVIKRAAKCKRILVIDGINQQCDPISILVCTCTECVEKSTNT